MVVSRSCQVLELYCLDLTVPPDEGGRTGPRALSWGRMDVDQELPASGVVTPGVATGGRGYGNQPSSEPSQSLASIQYSRGSPFLSPPAKGTSSTGKGEIEPEETSRGMCRHNDGVSSYLHVPGAKRARKGTLIRGVEDDTGTFGPLKVVLGSIPALCANNEVLRLQPSAQIHL